jgi:3-phenylpropionate/trans-cinnamate dioxygenase ferredoxin component
MATMDLASAMTDWVRVASAEALAEGAMTAVSPADKKLILYRTRTGYFATDRRCTHQGADLLRGYLDAETIECPVHQGRFDVRTGCVLGAPASTPLRAYPVKVIDGDVYVQIK